MADPMDPRLLAANLAGLGLPSRVVQDPSALLPELERLADLEPTDRAVSRALLLVADRSVIEGSTDPVLGGVRVDRLLRWDAWSMVWLGTSVSTGAPALVRALRTELARDPVFGRHLVREGRALSGLLAVEVDEVTPSLRVELSGLPASPRRGDAIARPLLTGLDALARWERAGLGLPELGADELRIGDDGRMTIACLWPTGGAVTDGVRSLAATLVDPADDSALAATVRAIGAHPPTAVEHVVRVVRDALAEDLAARRHALAGRWRETWQRSRELRLRDVVDRLYRAVPPPEGRGAVGVDLDGRITVVEGEPARIRWGADREGETVFDAAAGFRPPVARRLLRARAVSPPNPTLDARVSGDPAVTDAICRWVAAGLKLRTVQLLLERERG